MSRNAKIVVAIAVGIVLMCCCCIVLAFSLLTAGGSMIGRAVQTDPAKVAAAASNIADFKLPAGYAPEASINVGGFQFATYSPGDGRSHIMLIQIPGSVNVSDATLEQYARQAELSSGYGSRTGMHTVGQTKTTIRGQAATLTISEGSDADGQPFRMVSGPFRGKGGLAFLTVEEPLSRWNQATIDAFIASIR
jgi:hypothetical protein